MGMARMSDLRKMLRSLKRAISRDYRNNRLRIRTRVKCSLHSSVIIMLTDIFQLL